MSSLWQKIKQELDAPLDMVKRSLTDALDIAEDLTRKGRTKLEIQMAKSDIRTQMMELGGRVHQLAVEEGVKDVLVDDEVKKIFARIKKLEDRITAKEQELKEEKAQKAEKTQKKAKAQKNEA